MDDSDRIMIRRIFLQRRVSRDTFSYLCGKFPGEAKAEEIAIKIGASRTSVLGALRGNTTGYKKEESLEYFGLVAHEKKTIDKRTVVFYGLTSLGLKEKELAENHEPHSKNNREMEERAIEEGLHG